MLQEFQIKIKSQGFSTSVKANEQVFKYETYENYIRKNKYYIFYLIHCCYSDHIKDLDTTNKFDVILETPYQKIIFDSKTTLKDLYNMWYKTEISLLTK